MTLLKAVRELQYKSKNWGFLDCRMKRMTDINNRPVILFMFKWSATRYQCYPITRIATNYWQVFPLKFIDQYTFEN